MAEPNMELDTHDEHDSAPTYDIAIIDGNTVDTTKVFRWGHTDSIDGTITPVQIPASGNKWAEDFWLEDTDGTDIQLMDENEGPDESSGNQCYHLFKLTSDAAYASAPILTFYDDPADRATPDEEHLAGTSGHSSTFMKIVGATTSGQPAQYWGAGSSAALHALETGGSVVLGAAAQGLNGDVAYMTCTTASINSTPQYFSIAQSVPDDVTPGIDAMQICFTVKYTYT